MSVAAKLVGMQFGSVQAINTIELYLDFVCPFSRKQFRTLYDHVFPNITQYPGLQFIYRMQVQPWHPVSTLVAESAIAVATLSPDKFWTYANALFETSDKFYDSHTIHESRRDTYVRLAKLIHDSTGISSDRVLNLLDIPQASTPSEVGKNGGNKVTDLVKWQVKRARQNGIHVSPTITLNGVVENGISSSFSKDDWDTWLKANL